MLLRRYGAVMDAREGVDDGPSNIRLLLTCYFIACASVPGSSLGCERAVFRGSGCFCPLRFLVRTYCVEHRGGLYRDCNSAHKREQIFTLRLVCSMWSSKRKASGLLVLRRSSSCSLYAQYGIARYCHKVHDTSKIPDPLGD